MYYLITDNEKMALRYGYQRTHACPDYEKAYLCVRKCLDLQFDVAHSDKNCKCTCFEKKEKAKYLPHPTVTRWKEGMASTSMPGWYHQKKVMDPLKDLSPEILSVEETTAATDGGDATPGCGGANNGSNVPNDNGNANNGTGDNEEMATTAAPEDN